MLKSLSNEDLFKLSMDHLRELKGITEELRRRGEEDLPNTDEPTLGA